MTDTKKSMKRKTLFFAWKVKKKFQDEENGNFFTNDPKQEVQFANSSGCSNETEHSHKNMGHLNQTDF